MKRLFTFFVTALFLFLTANAQPFLQESLLDSQAKFKGQPYSSVSNVQSKTINKTASINAGEGQLWWSNHDSNEKKWKTNGTESLEHYNVATYIPSNFFGGDGIVISALSIYPIYEGMDNVKIWISKKLPEYDEVPDIETVNVPKEDFVMEQFNDVAFSNAHIIPSEGVYIGYSFDMKGWYDYWWSPILSSVSTADRDQGFLFNTNSSPSWQSGNGNLLMRVLLGGAFLGNAARSYDFQTTFLESDTETTVPITIENMGLQPITSIKYSISSDGEVVEEKNIDVQINDFKATTTIDIKLKSDVSAGANKKTFVIKEVNGVPNEFIANISNGKVVTIVDKPKVLPVIEEFTGTWCGYCPYGIVGMEKAYEQYGYNVALIAVHSSDPMAINEYSSLLKNVTSYPSAVANRGSSFYPNTYQLPSNIEKAMKLVVPGKIEAKASWSNKGKTIISIDTKTTFSYSEDNAQYGIAYVLVEDGMTDPKWYQKNFLSGESGSSEMEFWYNSPGQVYDVEFNHVAVAGWGVHKGIKRSVDNEIVEGQPINYNYKADISSNTLIQDKSRLKLIAMLVDSQTGKIMNAAITSIEASESESELGNADGKGGVNADDVVAIVNYLMNKAPDGFDKDAADVNGDGKVDLADIVMLINTILLAR